MDTKEIERFLNLYPAGIGKGEFLQQKGEWNRIAEGITELDDILVQKMYQGEGGYTRVSEFPQMMDAKVIEFYRKAEEKWETEKRLQIKSSILPEMEKRIGQAIPLILERFRSVTSGSSVSMERNFLVKVFFWLDMLAGIFLEKGAGKLVCTGILKKQEILFCEFLTFLGIHVLVLECEGKVPVYPQRRQPVVVQVRRPERDERTRNSQKKRELSMEELASLASAVVMIHIHDQNGEVIGGGSGIMISTDGYILTNHHVASGGYSYSVRVENDDMVYQAEEVIKYNQFLDLAIIRINRRLQPVSFYQGEKPLVRGQKVVAIGSPLGLFNSVSDGIISGFRNIRDVHMIQFTAPTSHGSSGGAVLNMYGEVIGISTAGFDEGQNLNLAVGYEEINQFIRGFYKR